MSDIKKRRIKRKKRNRIIAIIFAVLLIAYFVLQYTLVQDSKIEEIEAMEGYINDSFITQGIVLREETVLTASFTGEVDFVVSEGQRVSQGEKVADVYPLAEDVDNISKLNSVTKLKEELTDVQENETPSSSELSMAYRDLMDNIVELSNMQSTGSYYQINQEMIDISVGMNKLYMATGEVNDLSQVISNVSSQESDLINSISPIITSLYSVEAGYFIKSTDGYENVASLENFLNITKDEGKDIITNAANHTPSKNEYGKIVTDYRWYIAAYVPKDVYERLEANDKISVSLENGESQDCVIKNLEEKDDEYLIILESQEDAQNTQIDRIIDLEIIFHQYSGIKIPKEALRIIDGQLGVYVNFSEISEFKKIDPIYENEDYFILPIEGDENNEVRLYDSVITNGRNLYDGKYI